MKNTYRTLLGLAAMLFCLGANAQPPVLIHSHNDYCRTVPFYEAYSQKVASIEVDLFYRDGELLVGHDIEDLKPDMSFRKLYLDPAVEMFRRNGGQAYNDPSLELSLMIEIKSTTEPALSCVAEALGQYPDVFTGDKAIKVVITGNVPEPADFCKYPDFISFDGDVNRSYTAGQLARVAMFSLNFRDYSSWNGKGSLVIAQEKKVREMIAKVHGMGKPIRFWGAPDAPTVYYTFYNFGIDYINTDKPVQCAAFFSDWGNKNFQIGVSRSNASGVTGTHKLDKTTRDFSGFQNEKLQLSKPVDVYTPSFRNDGAHRKIKNVILLIGDGMGINQLTAAEYANKGLTITQLKSVGLSKTCAKDQFTTCSAAGGSALATGERHFNRHIAMSEDGEEYPSLTDWFGSLGKATGVLTLGNVVDATPTAFYGHNTERDDADDLTADLLDGHVDVVCGSGIREFTKRNDGRDILKELSSVYSIIDDSGKIAATPGKVLCIDQRMDIAAQEDNLRLLADATRSTIQKLQQTSRKGFFLMVEGAKIDYAGHSDCLPGSIIETLSFDMAVAEALRFADSNGETLVVITADHETGGLVVVDGDEQTGRVLGFYFSDDHTPSLVPVFAYGPYSDMFSGMYRNIEIPRTIKALVK